MTIKVEYQTIDEIPEQYRDLYQQRGDRWELQAEGIETPASVSGLKRALDAERDRARQIEQHWKPWAPLRDKDPAHIQAVLDKLPEYEAHAKSHADQTARVEEVTAARVKAATLPIERERDALREQHEQAIQRLQSLEAADRQRRIADAIREASSRVGLDPDSAEDAIMLGSASLEVAADGVVQVRDGVAGVPPGLDAERWLAHIRDSGKRPRWWAANVGGGLNGRQQQPGGPANPWAKETFNLQAQAEMQLSNPAMAKRLKDAASG